MRVILTTLALALPASAQDVADFGGTGCVLRPVTSQDHVAEIICRNVETTGNAWSEGAMTAGGLTVGLTIQHGPGKVPDVFTFTAPDGYVVSPPSMALDEFTGGVAVVQLWLGF